MIARFLIASLLVASSAAAQVETFPGKVRINSTAADALCVGSSGGSSPTCAGGIKGGAAIASTSVSTPSIITASGALGITPAAGSNLNITLSTTGDLAVNTNQFYVDTSAGFVGIGTTGPGNKLDVRSGHVSTTGTFGFRSYGVGVPGDANTEFFELNHNGTADFAYLNVSKTGTGSYRDLVFKTGGAERMRLFTSGGLSLGNTTDPGAANFSLTGKTTTYNAITTAGWGVPAIYGYGESDGQTGVVASVVTYTTGATNGSFYVSGNLRITAYTAGAVQLLCDYTDETNTAQTLTILAGTAGTGASTPSGLFHIRTKASSVITIRTAVPGFTGTYDAAGAIVQIGG